MFIAFDVCVTCFLCNLLLLCSGFPDELFRFQISISTAGYKLLGYLQIVFHIELFNPLLAIYGQFAFSLWLRIYTNLNAVFRVG